MFAVVSHLYVRGLKRKKCFLLNWRAEVVIVSDEFSETAKMRIWLPIIWLSYTVEAGKESLIIISHL